MGKIKNKTLVSLLLSVTGIALIIYAALINIPDFDSLEKISVEVSNSDIVSSGKNYPVLKLEKYGDCSECYFWTYAVDKEDFRYYRIPETSIVELWMLKGESDEQSRFVWQVSANDELLVTYKDIASVEAERRIILLCFGMLFMIILAGWLFYSREGVSSAT